MNLTKGMRVTLKGEKDKVFIIEILTDNGQFMQVKHERMPYYQILCPVSDVKKVLI